MAAAVIPQDLAAALRYGPQTQSAIQRSQYLADALRSLRDSGQQIGTPTELWTKLLATAITSWGKDRADKAAFTAVRSDQDAETKALLAGLTGATTAAGSPTLAAAAEPPSTAGPGDLAAALTGVPTVETARRAPAAGPGLEDARAAISAVAPGAVFTSGFRTPEHNAEVGGVPNSYHTRGQGQAWDFVPPKGVPIDQVRTGLEARGFPVAEALNEGDHYHVAWNGSPGGPDPAVGLGAPQQNVMPPQPPQAMAQPPGAGVAGAGPAPAEQPPQAAAGAVATMGPTPQQIDLVRRMLADPRYHDQGVAYAQKLQQEAAEAVKQDTVMINGVPYGRNPYTNQLVPIPVPEGSRTQVMSAQQAGIATAPGGTYLQRDPLGNIKDVPGNPPQGYAATAEGYAPIRGGPTDPYRVQPPQQGYAYAGSGQQAPIQGGPADPRNPAAILQGTESVRKEIAPIMDVALKLRRNVEGVRVGLAQQNGAGDIAAINGLQRLIDEGVVREGDVTLQLKGQGIAGGIAGLKGYLTSDGFFADPNIRQKIGAVADQLYGAINDSLKSRVMGYRPITENAYGPGSFDRFVLTPEVVEGMGWGSGRQPPPSPNPAVVAPVRPGTREAAIEEARKRGLLKGAPR